VKAAAGKAQFTPGGKREREHPRKAASINSTENHWEVTENEGEKKQGGFCLTRKKKKRNWWAACY